MYSVLVEFRLLTRESVTGIQKGKSACCRDRLVLAACAVRGDQRRRAGRAMLLLTTRAALQAQRLPAACWLLGGGDGDATRAVRFETEFGQRNPLCCNRLGRCHETFVQKKYYSVSNHSLRTLIIM
jgi:hypothetical protein